ncbi:calcium-activated chloride channel regulator 2 [Gallus gallus]|uniref:calcium-activated chloride channel regulator 2 n=1 Tax=Gallus gallus TaxID=9031 RepID=UPI001AE6DA82|nr:calcium-activated chloride channel regulator 2 [Gallus gallus]
MGSQCGLLAGFGSRVSALHPCRADRRGGAGHRRPPRGGCRAGRRGGNAAGARLVLLSPQLLCRGRRAAARRAAGGMSGGAAAGAALLALALAAAGEAAVVLRDGGYEGLLAAVHPRVPEDGRLVAHLQEMITEASSYLFSATKGRFYFRSVKILIPPTWKEKSYEKPKHETYEKADVIVAAPYWKHGDDPYTLQHEACGKMGKYIHFTPNFLANDYATDIYGSRGRTFVHEWAHLRWGVFDEYDNDRPFYVTGQNQVKVTRCSSDLTGIYVCEKNSCTDGSCVINKLTGLFKEGCAFIPERNQTAVSSIMYMQSLSSVAEFCNEHNHNREAPNLQNRMCDYRSTWEVIKNSTDFENDLPLTTSSLITPPSFSLLQKRDRVICLVLDVSKTIAGRNWINRLHQAAELYLLQIVEENTYVGIVTFSDKGEIKTHVHQIVSNEARKQLASYLPTAPGGKRANVCAGLRLACEVIRKKEGHLYGSEIILVTGGQDNSTGRCFSEVINGGSVIHTVTVGPSAAKEIEHFSKETGGFKFFVPERLDFSDLLDVFTGITSRSGDTFHQSIQIESAGESVAGYRKLRRTVAIDSTVGRETFFVATWQAAEPPEIILIDPTGRSYTVKDFELDSVFHVARLQIPGTAETGDWTYTLINVHLAPQVLTMTVTSRGANSTLPTVSVKTYMSKDTTYYPSAMVVYVQISQGFSPILGASVTAIISSENGDTVSLELLDNGAGSDIIKNDGIYSKYLFSFSGNGRYGLKVHVQANRTTVPQTAMPWSHAMYIPGYVENGKLKMNPSRPPAIENNVQVRRGGFSRTAVGDSFTVSAVPIGPYIDIFPPCKIIDLDARMEDDKVILTWTAPGDDFDKGQAASYEIRTSETPLELRDSFYNTTFVNTSTLSPRHAGCTETFEFKPEAFTTGNTTVIYVAIRAVDDVFLRSELSNIAQAVMFIPPMAYPTSNLKFGVSTILLLFFVLLTAVCLTVSTSLCLVKKKKKKTLSENAARLLQHKV